MMHSKNSLLDIYIVYPAQPSSGQVAVGTRRVANYKTVSFHIERTIS